MASDYIRTKKCYKCGKYESYDYFRCRGLGCDKYVCFDCVTKYEINVIEYQGFDSSDEGEQDFNNKYADTFLCESCSKKTKKKKFDNVLYNI